MTSFAHALGIGWRPELALFIERFDKLGFVEILAEDFDPTYKARPELQQLIQRGVAVVVHGVGLSIGSAEGLEQSRVERLARLATNYKSPIVSEHIAFVRADGRESGHLLPMPRSRESIEVLVENIHYVQQALPVPLALENISTLFEWPDAEMTEAEFVTEVLNRSGALLVLDVANVYANAFNHGVDALQSLRGFPLDRLAYVHVGGGVVHDGIYHDTHSHDVGQPVLDLLEELCGITDIPGVMLERDDHFPNNESLASELRAIEAAVANGSKRRNLSRY